MNTHKARPMSHTMSSYTALSLSLCGNFTTTPYHHGLKAYPSQHAVPGGQCDIYLSIERGRSNAGCLAGMYHIYVDIYECATL